MSNWRSVLLIVAVIGLSCLAVFTWGSLGSGVSIYCLITMGAALLFQKFVTNRDEDTFDEE